MLRLCRQTLEKVRTRRRFVISGILKTLREGSAQDRGIREKSAAFSQKYGADYLDIVARNGWTSPGHMFDEIGEIFSYNKHLFLVGTHWRVRDLSRRLAFLGIDIESFCVANPDEQDIEWLSICTAYGYTVILSYDDPTIANAVMKRMVEKKNHYKNINIFLDSDFVGDLICFPDIYLPIFSLYAADKVYSQHNCVLVTLKCNLNCKLCLNYTPYIKQQRHFQLEELKHTIDAYFTHIDHVGLLQLSGGEPLLYPYLQDILEYILENYKQKITVLCFVTNGTIVPKEGFLQFCKDNDIMIFLDDYRDEVKMSTMKFDMIYKKLVEKDIEFMVIKSEYFINTFPPSRKNLDMDIKRLQEKYRLCNPGMQNIRNGKMISCVCEAFAVNAELMPDAPEDWFDLRVMADDPLGRNKMVEYRLGFNKKGYLEWCKYCNGHLKINEIRGPAAEQAAGKLEWDIRKPYFLEDGKRDDICL